MPYRPIGVAWIDQIFAADQVVAGGIVRRSVDDVAKYASENDLLRAVRSNQYHMIRTGDQYVIICNEGVIQLFC